MSYQFITTAREDKTFILTINRPDVMNAISPAASHEMAQALDEFEQDDDLWVAIITGAGNDAFCAGGDIGVMAEAKTEEDYQMPDSGYGGMTRRNGCYKPIIAAVNGMAYGGGFEVALACDIIVASENASFGLPEPKIGTAAVASGLHRLPRHIGLKQAMAMLLLAEIIDAQKALSLQLVNQVVPSEKLMDTARKLAKQITHCAPLAVRATKQCVVEGLEYAGVEAAQAAQAEGKFDLLERMMKSEDIKEGLNAFLEKRRPQWQGK